MTMIMMKMAMIYSLPGMIDFFIILHSVDLLVLSAIMDTL